MNILRLASGAVFTVALALTLPARADVSPPCEACIFANEGAPCTDVITSKSGVCVKDTTGMCALACGQATSGTDAGADGGTGTGGGGGSGGSGTTTETGSGCSTAGAVGATGTLWALAALPIVLRRRRRASQKR